MEQGLKPKKKKVGEYRLNSWQFLLIWVGIHILVWLVVWFILDNMGRFNPLELFNAILMGLGFGIPIAIVQHQIVLRLLNADLQHWIPLSAIGWVIGGIILHVTASNNTAFSLQILLFFLIPALFQSIILWQHTRNAWLWVLANAVGGIVMSLFVITNRNDELTALTVGGALQTIVSGIAIYWLFFQPKIKKQKKAKSG